MGIESIGNIIADLRKEKGVTQDELAKYVGISAQAVSKWENGGVPDTELLPKIADFFSVSLDALFGRDISDYGDLNSALFNKIQDLQRSEKYKELFRLCWTLELAMIGSKSEENNLDMIRSKEGGYAYSRMLEDEGMTLMCLSEKLPYFMLVPECPDKKSALIDNIDYTSFFKILSDKSVFDALVLLNTRENKAFTPNLLVKYLGIDAEKAMEIIKTLKRYRLIKTTSIEMDDSVNEVYSLIPEPAFLGLLIFAREMIVKPNNYHFYCESRTKPYLK